tara:strand:+ start:10129 stop:10839 length:711 start_codon:yes stop_codon:yes gene_type:complete
MKRIYKKLVSHEQQVLINRWLRRELGDPNYLRIQRFFNAGALQKRVVNSGLCFIHVPKSAGTAVVRTIFGVRGVGHFKASTIKTVDREYFSHAFKFAIYRDPVERLQSAYRFFIQGGTEAVKVVNECNKQRGFSNFEEFVIDWLPNQDIEKLDYVFQLQSAFLKSESGDILVDKIYHIDNLALLENDVSQKLGREISFPRINATSSTAESISANCIKVIKEIYSDDYELEDAVSVE